MSFFSALTVPGLQQHLSFSREDSAILKGYGILFMIFHHVFGLYALPAGVDTAWIAPQLTKAAPIFKICVPIFILGPTYLTNHPTDHLQYSNNIVAKTDPTAPRTIVIIVDKIRVKTGLLFTKSKI